MAAFVLLGHGGTSSINKNKPNSRLRKISGIFHIYGTFLCSRKTKPIH